MASDALTDVRATSDGSIWIEREKLEPTSNWNVLDAAGQLRMTVRAEHALRILDSDGANVWAVESGASSLPRLGRFLVATH